MSAHPRSAKTVKESQHESSELMMPQDANNLGHIFGGVILSLLLWVLEGITGLDSPHTTARGLKGSDIRLRPSGVRRGSRAGSRRCA